MSEESPINLRANSFANFDDAMDLCDLLNRETGAEYTVMSDNHLGFTASRCRISAHNQEPKNAATDNGKENVAYRQSLRGFIEHYAEFTLGLFLMISPYQALALVFSGLDINEIPGWFSVSGCGETFRYIGIFLFLYSLRFVYSYAATSICFDNDGGDFKARDHRTEPSANPFWRHQNDWRQAKHSRQAVRHRFDTA